MKLREKLAARAEPYLEPGEQVRHTFMAQTGPSPYFFLLTYLIFFAIHYRIVVVTDRAVIVLRAGKFVPSKPKGDTPVARLPRHITFGPLHGLWSSTTATGEKMWVHMRFHGDVAAADAEVGSWHKPR